MIDAGTHAGGDGKQRYRILAVEDDPDVVESFKVLLEVIGNEVRTACDGPSALTIAQEFRPNVAFLDIDLPGMNGYEVAQRMRRKYGRELRLYALSGFGRKSDRERSMKAGFDRHLLKPIDLDLLQRLLDSNPT